MNRLLHITDLHFNQKACRWLENVTTQFDLLCISGDLFNDSHYVAETLEEQAIWYRRFFQRLDKSIYLCSGNHDWVDGQNWTDSLKMERVFTDGSMTNTTHGIIGCVPYGTVNFAPYKNCKILLHHEPPKGSKTARQNGTDLGNKDLLEALDLGIITPDYLLCGHVHQPKSNGVRRGENLIIVNPGSSDKSPKTQLIKL
ncbi:metallophosphoesterase family protein [Thaumasiovibrio sp. DFM-14]|uniref:metallophosphoesterase family protein n=1 Tax=Thaumasiovibrio sp. DFM-14 TaxID=3384792 RepID=UPI0039A18EDD